MTEPNGKSAGALLRAAREQQGLHIAALAAAIKVAPRKLDALENDRWDELPDATFTRALAQTVCRSLKIDAAPVLELLPAASGMSSLESAGGLNTPFQERPGREEPGLGGNAIRPMVWAASLLMLAAIVVYFLPQGVFELRSAAAPTASPTPTTSSTVVTTVAPVEVAAMSPTASAPTATGADSAATVSVAAPAPAPGGETVFSAPPVDAAVTAGVVQLSTIEASWIEVRDAGGQMLLSRTVQPGERVGLDGALPIRLTIGNASATRLGFRGKPVDLAASTRDNVARVELK